MTHAADAVEPVVIAPEERRHAILAVIGAARARIDLSLEETAL